MFSTRERDRPVGHAIDPGHVSDIRPYDELVADDIDPRRAIPQVERLVRDLKAEWRGLPRAVAVEEVRSVLDTARAASASPPGHEELTESARRELARRRRLMLLPVVNATGVLLHTNLGRAPMSARAIQAVAAVAGNYSNLELDLDTGRRGDRFAHVEPMLALCVGAQSALVVNNNAAAVLLVCAALARGREVVVSRGELIEIGGEFRIPDVLSESGATLVEVGTTNRTHLRDYERAIGEATAFLLKVHPSNYRVVGFTAAPAVAELAALAHSRALPLVLDAGSGLLGRAAGAAFGGEPVVAVELDAGADLVCFSGDKLLGGPQAGVICGRADLVRLLRRHPLLRAVRPDKMTLAALGETVAAHLEPGLPDLPLWRMLTAPPVEIERRAKELAAAVTGYGYRCELEDAESVAGGGSMPGLGIPTVVLRIFHPARRADALAQSLRLGEPPVVARVEHEALVLDLRTVFPEQDESVAAALGAAAG
jgi:L-seryl-tRNA(Ser) seleniumtransferase